VVATDETGKVAVVREKATVVGLEAWWLRG
jgi:hypothetical protein